MVVRKKVSVVIGSFNRSSFLKKTISSVRQELLNEPHEIIVVDGGSNDGSLEWLLKQKDIITVVQHNRGLWNGQIIERQSWGYFMNLGFKCAQGKYVCMLSDDCLVVPGAITNGVDFFEKKLSNGENIGAVAFYWRNWPEQKKYNIGTTLGEKLFVNHGLYLRDALEKVGYVDEKNYFFYCADGDLCLKLWEKGYKCLPSENSFIEHFTHTNIATRMSNFNSYESDVAAYLTRWNGVFYDPDKKNIGGWIEREYIDASETAKDFLGCLRFVEKLKLKKRFNL